MTSEPHKIFDACAQEYDEALQKGISVSGENKTYFARERLRWLGRQLKSRGASPKAVLDFGCGTGTATPFFFEELRIERVVGVDPSQQSIEIARRTYSGCSASFYNSAEFTFQPQFDLVFCNGVFHHILRAERPPALRFIRQALKDGGYFSLWENNPLNPGTRYVMSRIPFDRDAIPLYAWEAKRLLVSEYLQICETDYLFVFPRFLKTLRRVEPFLTKLPLGAQYQVLSRKHETLCSVERRCP